MRKPKPAGDAIDAKRYRGWISRFANFRESVTRGTIEDWLTQFSNDHQDVAARVLDCVQFIANEKIAAAFRSALKQLDGWDDDGNKRKGKWRFVPLGSSAGESSDQMVHRFRHANNLKGRQFNELFIERADLAEARLGPDDTVVFVDDFSGTGDQVIETWKLAVGELVGECGRVFLICVAASKQAIRRIEEDTGIGVVADVILGKADNVFALGESPFGTDEQDVLLAYCKKASKKEPKGRGECGFVIVFAHDCPNNTVAVLHAQSKRWEPLFPRYFHDES